MIPTRWIRKVGCSGGSKYFVMVVGNELKLSSEPTYAKEAVAFFSMDSSDEDDAYDGAGNYFLYMVAEAAMEKERCLN